MHQRDRFVPLVLRKQARYASVFSKPKCSLCDQAELPNI